MKLSKIRDTDIFESSKFSAETRRSVKSNPLCVNHVALWFTDAARVAANDLGILRCGEFGGIGDVNDRRTWLKRPLLRGVISRAVASIERAFRWFDSGRNGEMPASYACRWQTHFHRWSREQVKLAATGNLSGWCEFLSFFRYILIPITASYKFIILKQN